MNGLVRLLQDTLLEVMPKEIRKFFDSAEGVGYITQLGKVTDATGLPKVLFDSDVAPSGKRYAYVQAYTSGTPPAVNDKVVMVKVGHEWVVYGKIIWS